MLLLIWVELLTINDVRLVAEGYRLIEGIEVFRLGYGAERFFSAGRNDGHRACVGICRDLSLHFVDLETGTATNSPIVVFVVQNVPTDTAADKGAAVKAGELVDFVRRATKRKHGVVEIMLYVAC